MVNIPIQTLVCAVTAITQDDHRSQLELGPPVPRPDQQSPPNTKYYCFLTIANVGITIDYCQKIKYNT